MEVSAQSPEMPLPKVLFTVDDAERAYQAWGANCGLGALAGMLGKTLDEVRPHIPLFDQRKYTNPSMMYEALRSLGKRFTWRQDIDWPDFGLVRVQWEGPWLQPGVPVPRRYWYTHWVGACAVDRSNIGIFDINAIDVGGWVSLDEWKTSVVPFILEANPKADGHWHLTHSLELQV